MEVTVMNYEWIITECKFKCENVIIHHTYKKITLILNIYHDVNRKNRVML